MLQYKYNSFYFILMMISLLIIYCFHQAFAPSFVRGLGLFYCLLYCEGFGLFKVYACFFASGLVLLKLMLAFLREAWLFKAYTRFFERSLGFLKFMPAFYEGLGFLKFILAFLRGAWLFKVYACFFARA